MTKEKAVSFTLRVILGFAGLGIAVVVLNQMAGFIVPLLLAWIVVLSASPLYTGCGQRMLQVG